jgi:8-oxo-dGTP diphosphatase
MPYTYEFPRPSVTVDSVVFGIGQDPKGDPDLQVVLIERGLEPFKGRLALPGGFVSVSDDGDQGESIEDAAHRELREETGIKVDYLEQLCTIGEPGRDPRGRIISIAYMALVRTVDHEAVAGDDAKAAAWHSVRRVLAKRNALAFDHDEMLRLAYERLRTKARYAPIGFNLLKPPFAMSDLRVVYETILMQKFDQADFRRRILSMNILAEAGQQVDVPHRAGKLYRFDKRAYDRALSEGFNFELRERRRRPS